MSRNPLHLFVFSLPLLLALAGCQQQEEEQVASLGSGRVVANQAYLDNFGSPPQGEEGHALARVGYLPVKNMPGKVRAIPFFLFNEEDQLQKILDRLTGEMLLLPDNSPLYNPFPDDLEFSITRPDNQTVAIMLSTEQSWPTGDLNAAGRALAETALQFSGTERVHISLNDEPFPQMPADGYRHAPATMTAVGPPQLVIVAGNWQDETDSLEELLIEFDRPVSINNFELTDQAASIVEGEYFTSIFDMAVVVHPKNPRNFKEGTLLRVTWDVVDDLGRSNQGTNSLPLQRFEH